MAMNTDIRHKTLTFRYRLTDIRELDSEVLLRSASIEDNLLAILCGLSDQRAVVRRILTRIESRRCPNRSALVQCLSSWYYRD
jgi:hypothetical protein